MRFALQFSIVMVIVCLSLVGLAHAKDLQFMQIGDSIAENTGNRIASNSIFESASIDSNWQGDHSNPPTFARGGLSYGTMLNGSNALGAVGLIEILDRIENGTYTSPNVLYLLGGYNNAFSEAQDSSMEGSIETLGEILSLSRTRLPDAKIFVSNVTRFTGQSAHRQSNVETLNALIADEVASRDNVFLVDNYSLITAEDQRDDGLHLNSSGQQKIGENFANTVLAVPEPGSGVLLVGLLLPLVIQRRREKSFVQ